MTMKPEKLMKPNNVKEAQTYLRKSSPCGS